MPELTINKVVIHELVKEQHKSIRPSNLRGAVLDHSNAIVEKLVDEITSLYGRRNNAAHYGTFREDEGRGDFPDKFIVYTNIPTPSEEQFVNLSKVAMSALYIKAEGQTASSGGYILFVDYSTPQHGRFFLIAMIKQKEGIRLSSKLEPEELIQLDLNRLYQAARINYGKLSAYLAAHEEDRMDLSYLSFVSPSSTKAAAGYFVTALGCHAGVASARATTTIISASYTFFDSREKLKGIKKQFKNKLLTYMSEKQNQGASAKLSEVEEIARQFMVETETQTVDEQADDFTSFLNNEANSVPVEFPVNKPALNRYTYIVHTDDNWDIKIARRVISEDETAQIQYDRENKRLIINNIPEKLKITIEEELNEQNNKMAN